MRAPCPRSVHHVKLLAVGCGSLLWSEAAIPWVVCARYLGPRGEVTACVLCEWSVRSARRDRESLGFRFLYYCALKRVVHGQQHSRIPFHKCGKRVIIGVIFRTDFKEIRCVWNTYHIKYVSPCTATGFVPSMVPFPGRRVFDKV